MSKFKVGDKIRCVDNSIQSGYLTEGKVYVVIELDSDQNFVRIERDNDLHVCSYFYQRFELVQESGVLTPEEVLATNVPSK